MSSLGIYPSWLMFGKKRDEILINGENINKTDTNPDFIKDV